MKVSIYIFSITLLLSSCVEGTSSKSNNIEVDSEEVAVVEEVPMPNYTQSPNNTYQPEESEVYIDWDRINTEANSESDNTYTYSYSESYDYNNSNQSKYSNYEPSSNDCEGIVVYEGRGDYFIVETRRGFTVLEVYNGILYEDQKVKGKLNSYNWHYILNVNRDSEVRVYIEDYMLSAERAIEWLGEHNKLKYNDQEIYDREND